MQKTIKSGMDQIELINYLENLDLIPLGDEKLNLIIFYRKKYPEVSFQELADIISMETDYKVGKSGINHHFRSLRKIKENYEKKQEESIWKQM